MRLAFVTLAAGKEFSRMAALVNPAKRRYCSRFGYDFIAIDKLLDASRPPAWSKIPAIQRVLPNYDWLFWCDTDAVLWNPDIACANLSSPPDRPTRFFKSTRTDRTAD